MDPNTAESDPALGQLGQLVSDSHVSCKDVYECTVPQTDNLQTLCLSLGALGSRQTGGGWGGAVISLVKKSEVPSFLEKIRAFSAYQGLSDKAMEDVAFATLPGSGAGSKYSFLSSGLELTSVYVVDGDIKKAE